MLPVAREVGQGWGSRERLLRAEVWVWVWARPGCWDTGVCPELALQHPVLGEGPVDSSLCLLCPL